jgi:hypothetical protein
MSPARGPCRPLLAALAVIGVAGPISAARADDSADRGISLSAWVGGALDRSVTAAGSGRRLNEAVPIVGATGVGNIERVAIGGSVDATPAALGNARLALGALLGYERQIGRTRFHVLGEAGGHRFSDVGGAPLGPRLGPDTWLPYAGVRIGAARTVPAHGFLELGLCLFGRYDLGRATVANVTSLDGEGTRSDYRLGGLMTGVAVQLGMRLDSPHPWNQGVQQVHEVLE